jgi:PAS domain S-box-containing protein
MPPRQAECEDPPHLDVTYPAATHPDVPLLPLPEFLLLRAATNPDKPALIDGPTGRVTTYGQLAQAATRTAAGLAKRGFGKGDVLAICSPNLPEYAVAVLGAGLAGGIVSTINPLYTAIELTHQLRDSRARVLVVGERFAAKAAEAVPKTLVEDLFVFGKARGFGKAAGAEPFDTLSECPLPLGRVAVDPREDVAAVLYSGATTGLPKGVMLTHFNLVANLVQMQAVERMAAEEVVVGVMPFHHIYGFHVVLNLTLHAGCTLVIFPRFEVEEFLRSIQDHGVTTAFVVPPIVRALAHHPLVDRYDLTSLRYVMSAAAPLPEELARVCADRLGCLVKQAYGLTETGPTTHWTPRNAVRLNSAGPPVPGTECRVIDVATKCEVPVGGLGEIWVRGPQVMKGYLNNLEVTRRVLDEEGWFRTKDIGYADGDGYIYVLDRANDPAKFRGLQYQDDELLLRVVEDRTRQRDDQQRLRFQSLLLDSVRESIVGIDEGRAVTYWNNGAQALFGYTADEAMGRPIEQLILLEDQQSRGDWEQEIADLSSNGAWQGQVQRRRKDGSVIWTDVVASVVKGSEGNGYIAIHRDRTELRRSETMLRESHERLQHLAAGLIDVREQERSAIARELHDELGQALTRLNMDLVWLAERLPRRLQTKRTEGMASLVDRMSTTVQHLSSRLRPAILDDFGLEAAIEWQAQEFEEWNGTRCRLDLRLPPLPADRDRDTTVFRIVQESLTNVARHADAKSVDIRCEVFFGAMVLEVVDDGVGIAEGMAGGPSSLGVLGMRERARAIGAQIEILPRIPRGTMVRLCVPIERDGVHP